MKTLYIKDLQKGLIIEGETFLVVSVDKAVDKNGKDYYNVILGDKTGKVSAKIWADKLPNIDTASLKSGRVVSLDGKVDEFRGNVQLTIYSLSGVDETKLDDFLETSMFDPEEMYDELLSHVDKVSFEPLKIVLQDILKDEGIRRRLKYWPAANTIHHDFRSGLLQHILEMIAISKGLERFYTDVNFDILLAGIILHDLGKIYELDGMDLAIPYTKVGYLLGHVYLGTELFDKFSKDKLPEDVLLHVKHLILSHHGKAEFGAPVLPATTEAILLTYIDNVSAKARTADKVKKEVSDEDGFSGRVFWLENQKIWNFQMPSEDEDQLSLV